MKQFILPIVSLLFTLQLSAQIVVERSDYLLTDAGAEVKSWSLATADLTAPEEGADVTWDYSATALTSPFSYFKDPISGDPTFPEANLTEPTTESFLGLVELPVVFYERIDDNGFGTLGRVSSSASLPLGALTGGANDTITTLPNTTIYGAPTYYTKFPLAYQDSWQTSVTISPNFLITVEGFGLDQAPASQSASFSTNASVVGYGTLILPNPDGSGGSVSMEALLLRADRVKVDSFFLAGQPAPPAMLGALGLEQGEISTRTTYSFYAKGLPRTALTITVVNGQVNAAGMSADVTDLMNSTRFVAPQLAAAKVFPNPTSGEFQVEFEKTDAQPWTLHLYNALGQQMKTQVVEGPSGLHFAPVSLPANAASGNYQVILRDGNNVATAMGRIWKE